MARAESTIDIQPLIAHGFPGVFLRFIVSVPRQASGERGIAQQTDDICGERSFVAHRR